jgi:hypothetical protein
MDDCGRGELLARLLQLRLVAEGAHLDGEALELRARPAGLRLRAGFGGALRASAAALGLGLRGLDLGAFRRLGGIGPWSVGGGLAGPALARRAACGAGGAAGRVSFGDRGDGCVPPRLGVEHIGTKTTSSTEATRADQALAAAPRISLASDELWPVRL